MHIYIYISHFIYSSVAGHIESFSFLTVVSSAAVDTWVWMFVEQYYSIPLGNPTSGIARVFRFFEDIPWASIVA